MAMRPVPRLRRRSTPLKPPSWVDNRVIIMDASGRVLRRVEPSDFAKRDPRQQDES